MVPIDSDNRGSVRARVCVCARVRRRWQKRGGDFTSACCFEKIWRKFTDAKLGNKTRARISLEMIIYFQKLTIMILEF